MTDDDGRELEERERRLERERAEFEVRQRDVEQMRADLDRLEADLASFRSRREDARLAPKSASDPDSPEEPADAAEVEGKAVE